MTLVRKFIVTLLHLKGIFVCDFQLRYRDKELHLYVRPYKTGCRCPHCGRRGGIVHISFLDENPRPFISQNTLGELFYHVHHGSRECLCY